METLARSLSVAPGVHVPGVMRTLHSYRPRHGVSQESNPGYPPGPVPFPPKAS